MFALRDSKFAIPHDMALFVIGATAVVEGVVVAFAVVVKCLISTTYMSNA